MFFPIRFKTNIQIPISELQDDFNEILLSKLRNDFEGKCSRFGFIKPESILIEKRSSGKFIKQHFNGYVSFEVISKAEACNPPKNTRIEAIVKNKNALGILAESVININGKDIPILDIIVPRRAAGIVSEIDLDELNIGDKFNIMVMGKSYQLNDSKISIIGRGVNHLNVAKSGEINEIPDIIEGEEENSGDENSEEENSEKSQEEEEKSDDESETKVVGGLDLYEDEFLGGENSEDSELNESDQEELSDEEEYVGGYDDYE
mgnify:CR=1 FL=1